MCHELLRAVTAAGQKAALLSLLSKDENAAGAPDPDAGEIYRLLYGWLFSAEFHDREAIFALVEAIRDFRPATAVRFPRQSRFMRCTLRIRTPAISAQTRSGNGSRCTLPVLSRRITATPPAGERFSHTLFLCPDTAAVQAYHVRGTEHTGVYHFETDPAALSAHENAYRTLLSSCHPLVRFRLKDKEHTAASHTTAGSDTILPHAKNAGAGEQTSADTDNLKVTVNDRAATVSKLTPPFLSFSFFHPLMRRAFRAYLTDNTERL